MIRPLAIAAALAVSGFSAAHACSPRTFTVYFAFDSLEGATDDRLLTTVVEEFAGYFGPQSYDLLVDGHADGAGPEAYNLDLSRRRAERVRDLIVRRGVPAARISVAARGESAPAVPNGDRPEPLNRRVELSALGSQFDFTCGARPLPPPTANP
jgi:outer membrane protein OmpA-like peptidoglycan-associated protein